MGSELHRLIGVRLRALRGRKTQLELANAAGVKRSNVAMLETGKAGCSLEVLYRLAEALGVEATELLPTHNELNGGALPAVEGEANAKILAKYLREEGHVGARATEPEETTPQARGRRSDPGAGGGPRS